jgi:hypothetical protein
MINKKNVLFVHFLTYTMLFSLFQITRRQRLQLLVVLEFSVNMMKKSELWTVKSFAVWQAKLNV